MRDDNFCGKRMGLLSPVCAARLAGRLGFAASQLFDRSGSACLWHFRQRAGGAAFSVDLLTTLHEWANTLRSAPPREVKLRSPDPPVRLREYRCCGFRCSHLGHVHRSRRIVLFVDNDAARYGVMKGYSPSEASAWLLTEMA